MSSPQTILGLPGPVDWPLLNEQWCALGNVQERLEDGQEAELLQGLWEFLGTLICENEPRRTHDPR